MEPEVGSCVEQPEVTNMANDTTLTPNDLNDQARTQRQTAGLKSDPPGIPSTSNFPPLTRNMPVPNQGAQNTDATMMPGGNAGIGKMVNGVPTFSDGSGLGTTPRTVSDAQLGSLSSAAAATPNAVANSPSPVLTRAPLFGDVRSGAAATPNSAESASGRPLGIGQMVGGVATFSDGSIPGTPKTISDNQMQQLIQSSAQPRNPYLGPEGGVLSAANGGNAITQDQGVRAAMLTRTMPNFGDQATMAGQDQPTLTRRLPTFGPGAYSPDDAAASYKSDLASILNKDPRSPLGIAARNISVDASHAVARSRSGSSPSEYDNQLGALLGAVKDQYLGANQAGEANARDQTQYGNGGLNNDARLANTNANATAGNTPAIPQGAIDRLKKNPHKYADFDAMFGAGAAARYLGPSGG
jgi:hypothetical protein